MSNWPSKKENVGAGKRREMSLENENYQAGSPSPSPGKKDKDKTNPKTSMQTVRLPPPEPSSAATPTKSKVDTKHSSRGSSPATPPPSVGPFRSAPASPSQSAAVTGGPFRVSPMRNSNQIPLSPLNTEKQYSKLEKTQQQVDDVKGVMRDNLDRVLERGDKLTDLDARAEHLELSSQQFAHTAQQLKKTMWWKSKKFALCIALVVFIVLAIIALVAYFLLRPSEPQPAAPGSVTYKPKHAGT
ncbi:synaptobrevin-like [Paramacrobiotus metropolitanus]|uniref:synaptobrevin-like n=1 Tax=Paramacrobiotus metropolitanus TaxID=2943436 RepID=UPI0024460FE2|nr:synaptobrevin-like [Paramacrobiotus metropolitanus]